MESDHFLLFGASASTSSTVLNFMEAAHQCFVEEWCWRSTGRSITRDDGTYSKQNIYSLANLNAGGLMQYDDVAGLAYLQVLASQVTDPLTTVHEYGHALTLAAKGWVDQPNTGFWWESVANFVAFTFMTSPTCEKARTGRAIKALTTIPDGTIATVYGLSYTVIVNNQNYYQAWPFLTYLTNNPDGYPGIGKMTLPDMWRLHKGNNETPLHELERMASPVKVQTILGRYWARMAYLDIGLPAAQKDFLASRGGLSFGANWDGAGSGVYKVKQARRPQYGGANITPLKVTASDGAVAVKVTNLGNGLPESDFTATLAIRSTRGGAVRYVELPGGAGQATVASDEEASLVVVNTPTRLYMYNPESTKAPETTGLSYEVQLTGAAPAR